VAVDPSGKFAYVANSNSFSVSKLHHQTPPLPGFNLCRGRLAQETIPIGGRGSLRQVSPMWRISGIILREFPAASRRTESTPMGA